MIPQGRVAETFFSIQGEGPTAGLPAVFIRLQGCSVGCQWCDTRYSWDPGQGDSVDVSRLLAQALGHPCRRVVITGGEPLESSLFESLLSSLHSDGFTIEVETSATVAPTPEARALPVQWNASPKLASSGVPEERRLRPEAIEALRDLDTWWKLVVAGPPDLQEALSLVKHFALPAERVLLQPEAARREDLIERSPWLVEQCKRHGFRFSPRLHILLWGPRRGV